MLIPVLMLRALSVHSRWLTISMPITTMDQGSEVTLLFPYLPILIIYRQSC